MKKINILGALAVVMLTSCKDEIEMDYNKVEPIVVIEGRACENGTVVTISRTRDMEQSESQKQMVSDAVVSLSTSNGDYELANRGEGVYVADYVPSPEDGLCTLVVEVDGKVYTATSSTVIPPSVDEAKFVWDKIFESRIVIYRLEVQTATDDEHYYLYRSYRNNRGYKWGTFGSKGNRAGWVTKNITLFGEDDRDEPEDHEDDILWDGDTLSISLYAIDRQVYDYLNSLGMSSRSSANPNTFFTGGALGVFSVETIGWTSSTIFNINEVED